MSVSGFSTAEVALMTGLTVRQLDYWAQHGIFSPGIQQSHGPGSRKLYSADDIIQLRALHKLKCFRWSTQKLHRAIVMLREVILDPNPLRQAMLVSDSKTLLAVYKTKHGEQALLDGVRAGGQHVLSLVIETVEEETRQLILNLSKTDNDYD
jgi:DNA-binding transcriptional MerR regulator